MTSRFVSVTIAVAVAVSFLFLGAGAVAAHGNNGYNVGASGHCSDDANDTGGGGSVGASPDDSPEAGDFDAVDEEETRDIAAGVQRFVEAQQGDGECGSDDDSDSYDFLEAHAGNGNDEVQVCYSQDTDDENPPINASTSGGACHP